MRKFLLGIFCGVLLVGLALVVFAAALVRLGGPQRPAVENGSTLMLRLEGEIGEVGTAELPFFLPGQPSNVTVHEVWSALKSASKDSRIAAVAILPAGVGAGWGKLEEIRRAILEVRRSGKPVYAWLRNPGLREYYLASAAERIYLAPEDLLNVKGLRAEVAYYKNTLDKVGVKMEIESAGKYKDAGDMLSRTNSTPESREVINSILDGVYAGVIAAVAEGRKMEPEQVRALIDQGPFLAGKAKAARLIDETYYEDQFLGDLTRKLGQKELKKASLRAYASAVNDAAGGAPVALIAGVGSIGRGGSGGMNEDSAILSEDFVKLLRQAADDDSLKGAIVRIDSPGGDAVASDDILREMKLLSKKKPLVISMSDVAASGGYYVAATGDPIIAYPNTITGSIGVVYGKPNVAGLYDKLGISREFYQRGKNAALDSIDGPMTPEARAKLREGIDSVYEGFVQRVAEARRTTPDKIRPVAEGRAWLGSQAKDAGLVDRLGGMDSAIAALRERAELGTDEKIKLIPYPPRRNLLTKLFSQPTEVALEAQLARVQREFGVKLPHLSVLQGGYLRLMPFSIDLR